MMVVVVMVMVANNVAHGGHLVSKVSLARLEHNWWPKVATRSIINIITPNISITIAPHHHNYQYQAKNSIVQ